VLAGLWSRPSTTFIEELSAKASQPPAPPPPDPKIEAMKMDAQMRQQEAEMQAQIKQGEAQIKRRKPKP
jgi:hypothetical protein